MSKTTNYYNIHFKDGDYLTISNALWDKFPLEFSGSGYCLHDGSFDVNFKCSSDEIKKIVSYVQKHFQCIEIRQYDNVASTKWTALA